MENIGIIVVLVIGLISVVLVIGSDSIESFLIRKHEAKKLAKRVRNQVSCNTCKCLINKEDCYEVKVIYDSRYRFHNDEVYYCQKCKPAYSSKICDKYYKVLEVTEQGEPVGYIKKK